MANAAENRPIGSACGGASACNESSSEEYWTEERRARAVPVPMPKLPKPKPGGGQRPATAGEALPKGPPGHTPGQAPHSLGEEKNAAPTLAPPATNAQPVKNPLAFPYCTIGKLFYEDGNGNPFSGSAALIHRHILLTAGHNVWNLGAGQQYFQWDFFPSYMRDGHDPAFRFKCSWCAWKTGYTQKKDLAYDYAMLWIDADVGKLLGWLGLAWNQSKTDRTWNAVGYPGKPDPPFNGKTMEEAFGTYVPSSTAGMVGLTNNNMEEGSSGGPWITDPISTTWNDTSHYHANGVMSAYDGRGFAYSPYFTQEVHNLMLWISNPANRQPLKPAPFPPSPRH
jgi:V8-like Glu-specific endopeptidase